MSKRSTRLGLVAETLAEGFVQAGHAYHEFTRGWAPWWAPESYYRDAGARALFKELGVQSVPEMTVNGLRAYGEGEWRGALPRGSKSGRIDLVALNAHERPRILIEVKRNLGVKLLDADRRRLSQFVGRGVAKWAMIAVHGVLPTRQQDPDEAVRRLEEATGLERLALRQYTGRWSCLGAEQTDERLLVAAVFRVY